MEDEIRKAIDSGKLTAQAGSALSRLSPGAFCTHKSWGFGRIASLDIPLNQIVVDFKSKKGHAMQIQYAAESLQPIPPDHILALKATDPAALKALAAENPSDLVRKVLASFGNRATTDQIAATLIPEVFDEPAFKRWWDATKKTLKSDGHFHVPAKKSEPVELRDAPVSRKDELLAKFANARQLKDQLAALEEIVKNAAVIGDASTLLSVAEKAATTAQQAQRLHGKDAIMLLAARDELAAAGGFPAPGISLAEMIAAEAKNLGKLLDELPASKVRATVAAIPSAFGEEWPQKALALLAKTGAKVVPEIARLLQDRGHHESLRKELNRLIRDHSISSEILVWLCKERQGAFGDLVTPEVFGAILSALEREQMAEKRSSKLADLIADDRNLVTDILDGADLGIVRDAMRKLLLSPVFEELDKRAIIGRIVRLYPEMQALLVGGESEREETLIVSWPSLEKRKAEYDELVRKKIPQNTQDIAIARSYGDLRENFEFKSAKEQQRVLMRRKAEMERDLARARGTDFANPDTSQVGIGTVVVLRPVDGRPDETYTILGAWDTDPARHVISYLSAMAQALSGRKQGETVTVPTEHGSETVTIVSIGPWQP